MKNQTRGERYAADHAKDLGEKLREGGAIVSRLLAVAQGHDKLTPEQALELGADAGRWHAHAFEIAGELEA